MRGKKILFFEDSLDDLLRFRVHQAQDLVNGIPNEQFLISSDDEIIENFLAKLSVTPLKLHEELISVSKG